MSSQKAKALFGALLEDPQVTLAKITAVRARREGSNSFSSFVRQAWQYVGQVEPLVWNWHMEAIAMHLEAVARGEINWLAINIPPGHAKSVFTSVLWPAWIWTWWPKCQFIFGSYSQDFAIRDARRCRDLIESDWYQNTFCKFVNWGLRGDRTSAADFENTVGGVRFTTSVSGSGAGLRAHVIGIDDPLNIKEAHSERAREEATRWISQTMSQRFVAGYPKRFALTMQRLHAKDPTAFVLQQKGAQNLRLPSEFEPEDKCVTYRTVEKINGHVEKVVEKFWEDPRKEKGELLFPSLFDRARIDSDKTTLGPFGYASQHAQRPSPDGGGLFKMDAWRFWKPDKELREKLGYQEFSLRPRGCFEGEANPIAIEQLEEILISVDATFKKTISGSFVAIHVWGKQKARRLLLDRVHRRMDFTETVHALLSVIERWPEARRKLIEGKANGDAIISTLQNTHGVIGLEAVPVSGSKEQRANAMQPYQSAGNVELPDGAPWLEEYVKEHAEFPNAANDDDVDCQSQALQGFERERTATDELMENPNFDTWWT